jgi:hypothetical protein
VIILSLMIASFGTLSKLPKDVNHQNPGIFRFFLMLMEEDLPTKNC